METRPIDRSFSRFFPSRCLTRCFIYHINESATSLDCSEIPERGEEEKGKDLLSAHNDPRIIQP